LRPTERFPPPYTATSSQQNFLEVSKKNEECYVFLFNDILLVCKVLIVPEDKQNLEIRGKLELIGSSCKIEENCVCFASKKGKTITFKWEGEPSEELLRTFNTRETEFY